ncbi:hypothetical protein DUK53_04700 [Listeria sp. SHR_NRA_18]|uniref:hypothetical protein n=1 Tax=Listeria sp. SHR_NRA_18 TaxID=2269046 RepID=UPI00051D0484|nr:hypothetical protein [Listeria sp. SHR_NRA_18]KGL42101.1 hypothetical protein EP56_10200 [Listeriaceae bacterium FSL A5-0209]RQW67622.1 hypothetical protein DUK53_04700 [Listeria sp. SHR_NRA_18]
MLSKSFNHDFSLFCHERVEHFLSEENSSIEFKALQERQFHIRDVLEQKLNNDNELKYLDELFKYETEAFMRIYATAFKEGILFSKNPQ